MGTKKKSSTKAMTTKKATKKKPAKTSRATASKPKAAKGPGAEQLKSVRVESLTKVFQALGAKTPEKWAQTQVEEGTDELGRFVLLRALWFRVVEPGRLLANARKEKGVAEVIDSAMKKLDLAELDALVRFAQRTALDDVCKVLDDPASNDDGIRWSVYRVDASGKPLWPLAPLRKDLVETEP